MADRLSAGMTREAARALLLEHNKDPFHIEHGETVEQVMRYFAREFDPDNEEFWGIVGLLHDLDWEEHARKPSSYYMRVYKEARRRSVEEFAVALGVSEQDADARLHAAAVAAGEIADN